MRSQRDWKPGSRRALGVAGLRVASRHLGPRGANRKKMLYGARGKGRQLLLAELLKRSRLTHPATGG
eukprot:6627586-Pyramimonas_sp.AAC.1